MLCFPNCKINLGLYVTGRRSDGYHNLETVFFPLPFSDVLEIIPAPQTNLHQSGIPVAGSTGDNLVLKAYTLLQAQFPGKAPSFDIYLHKVIPMGAGLGGGSADGAFMLQLVNDFCGLQLTQQELAELSLQLGSDCPFFIYNTPQFATGRGEKVSPVTVDLSAYSIQLICPRVHVSTRDAFSSIVPKPAPFDLSQLGSLPLPEWKHTISNDFETPVFSLHPVLADIKAQLYAQGAVYASMSGSGSAIYGIFKKGERAIIDVSVGFSEVSLF
jgi:4-diphosphocytidyl-2-C-methyl-D-erythritol kinase